MANLGSLIPWRDKTPVPRRDEDHLDPFLNFRREVDRMFDDFFAGSFGRLPAAFGGSGFVSPTIDVEDREKELVVTAELPGLDAKDFDVTLAGDVLTIKGEKKDSREEKRNGGHYVERRFGSFARSVRLPFEAGDQKVDASYDKGVLTIRVPKPPELTKPARRIDVKSV
jgi:HSP20 family protein